MPLLPCSGPQALHLTLSPGQVCWGLLRSAYQKGTGVERGTNSTKLSSVLHTCAVTHAQPHTNMRDIHTNLFTPTNNTQETFKI